VAWAFGSATAAAIVVAEAKIPEPEAAVPLIPVVPPRVEEAALLLVVIVSTPVESMVACRLSADSAVLRSFSVEIWPVPVPKVTVVAVPLPVAPMVSVSPLSALEAAVPAVEAVNAMPVEPHVDEQDARLAGLHLLVAEDNPVNLQVVVAMLEGMGARVAVALDGAQAVAQCRNGHFDALLLDIQMPGMDGYEAARRIREEGARRMPIVAVTANAMSTDRELALAAGMNDHLPKPLTRESLAATVLKWTRPEAPPG